MNLYSYFSLCFRSVYSLQFATKHLHVKLFDINELRENRRKENRAFAKGLNEITFAQVPVKFYDIVKVKNASVKRLSPCCVLFKFFNRLLSVLAKPLEPYPHLSLPSPPIAVRSC